MDADLNGYCNWWLRTPGEVQSDAATVYATGSIYNFGHAVNHEGCDLLLMISYGNTVRPAMWIDLRR